MNFPFICSYIPAVYISQLILYSRACGSHQDFLDRGLLRTRKLLNQGFILVKLKSSLRKFSGRHHDLVNHYELSVSRICSTCRKHFPVLSSFMTYYWICSYSNTTGATSGAGAAYPSRAPELNGIYIPK